jgi:hypothetical protein
MGRFSDKRRELTMTGTTPHPTLSPVEAERASIMKGELAKKWLGKLTRLNPALGSEFELS